jgi:hypothetical protein
VAGFDYEFTYDPRFEAIVGVCIGGARARANRLAIRLSFRTTGANRTLVTVDGQSRRLNVLAYRLERDLPKLCEGFASPHYGPKQRRRIGLGFADMYVRGRDMSGKPATLMRLTGVSDTKFYYPVYELTPQNYADDALLHRMRVAEELLADWEDRSVSPFIILEELCTAAELLLHALFPDKNTSHSLRDFVKVAAKNGIISREAKVLLDETAVLRNSARHTGDSSFAPWLVDSWEDLALVLEHLSSLLGRASVTASKDA